MSLEQQIMPRLKEAMKAKDEAALRTLRAIKAAILVEKTATGGKSELTEAAELKMLTKMAKQRKESIAVFEEQNRADLAEKEKEELAILVSFLPEAMSAEQLTVKVADIIKTVAATGPKDMGKVMGLASKQLAGQADGKDISDEVKKQLATL